MNLLANDSLTLILTSYALTAVSVFILYMYAFNPVLRVKYPRLLDTAVWCFVGAVVLVVVEVVR